jgi:hypothetical protein
MCKSVEFSSVLIFQVRLNYFRAEVEPGRFKALFLSTVIFTLPYLLYSFFPSSVYLWIEEFLELQGRKFILQLRLFKININSIFRAIYKVCGVHNGVLDLETLTAYQVPMPPN